MGDEFGLPLLRLLDQDGLVLGHGLIHRDHRLEPVSVEHFEHAEDAHPIAVLVIAVAADVREPADFLAHLKYKAGLPPDFWDQGVKLSRYTVQKWREEP